MKQVVKVDAAGGLTGLRTASGVSLTKMGRAEVERISEAVFDPDVQKWYVVFSGGLLGRIPFNRGMLVIGGVEEDEALDMVRKATGDRTLYWQTYEDAVEFEVAFVNWCLVHGCSSLVMRKGVDQV